MDESYKKNIEHKKPGTPKYKWYDLIHKHFQSSTVLFGGMYIKSKN